MGPVACGGRGDTIVCERACNRRLLEACCMLRAREPAAAAPWRGAVCTRRFGDKRLRELDAQLLL